MFENPIKLSHRKKWILMRPFFRDFFQLYCFYAHCCRRELHQTNLEDGHLLDILRTKDAQVLYQPKYDPNPR